jgi:hypothetical protein
MRILFFAQTWAKLTALSQLIASASLENYAVSSREPHAPFPVIAQKTNAQSSPVTPVVNATFLALII